MYKERKKLFYKIEKMRKRPLITYVTSIRPSINVQMASDAITPIIQQIDAVPKNNQEIDFLIISNGGDPITSLRIISILREKFKKVSVLIPYVAYSAATVLSLGADEIVMHPYSNLGPIDPQLTTPHNNGKGTSYNLHFSSEDLRNYIEFLKSDVGITDQEYLVSAIQPLLNDFGAFSIGFAKRSQQLTLSLSERMLLRHIKDTEKAKNIAKLLNTSYYHHGYAVDRNEAKKIGLPVVYPNQELADILWTIWNDYSSEMLCDNAFDPIAEIMNDSSAKAFLSQIPMINWPANLPKEIADQLSNQLFQQLLNNISTINRRLMLASIESVRLTTSFYNDINIAYWRNSDMSLGINCTQSTSGWVKTTE